MKNYNVIALVSIGLSLIAWPALAQSYSIHVDGGKYHMMWSDDSERFEVTIRGEVTFRRDDAGIKGISKNGSLEIEERLNGVWRFVRVESEAGGLQYTYRVDGRHKDLDQAWFARVILRIIRESGLDAEERVAHILKEEGVEGVFEEVSQIRSSSVKARYLTHLVEQGHLNASDLRRTARFVAKQIKSGGTKLRFLTQTADAFFAKAKVYPAYFDVVDSISSSGDKARVLKHLLSEKKIKGAGAYLALLKSAKQIQSSGTKSRVLIQAAPLYVGAGDTRRAYFEAVNTIRSSGDHARILHALLETGNLDKATLLALLDSAKRIQSSGGKSRVLIHAAPALAGDDDLVDAYLNAAGTIRSSGDHQRTLSALLN